MGVVALGICGSEATPEMVWHLKTGARVGVPTTLLLFPYPSFDGILDAKYDVNCPVSASVPGNEPPRIVAALSIDPIDNAGNSTARGVHNPQGNDRAGQTSGICSSCARIIINTSRKSGRDDQPSIVYDVLPLTNVDFRFLGSAEGYDGNGVARVARNDGIWRFQAPRPDGCLSDGARQAAIDNGEGETVATIEALIDYNPTCNDSAAFVQWPRITGPGGESNWRRPRRPISTTIIP